MDFSAIFSPWRRKVDEILGFCKIWLYYFGLGEIEKTDIAPKLGQNGILQAFLKNLFESTWPSEVILLKRKFRFISQKLKLESNVET